MNTDSPLLHDDGCCQTIGKRESERVRGSTWKYGQIPVISRVMREMAELVTEDYVAYDDDGEVLVA